MVQVVKLALTPLLREDNTRSPSTVAITTYLFAFDDLATIEGVVVLSSLSRGVNAGRTTPAALL